MKGRLEYNTEIAKAVYGQCVYCHTRWKEIDFFKSDDDFQHWANMNRMLARTMRMPPSGAEIDPRYSSCALKASSSNNEQHFKELKLVHNWLEQGSPMKKRGKLDRDKLKEIISKAQEKKLIKSKQTQLYDVPDLLWKMNKPHIIAATGELAFSYVKIAGPTQKDYYVSGFTANFNLNVAHHVNIMIFKTDPIHLGESEGMSKKSSLILKDPSANKNINAVDENIVATYSRRSGLVLYPKNTKLLIPKGSYVVLQIHYNPSGRIEKNLVQIGVHLTKESDETKKFSLIKRMRFERYKFTIPPQTRNFLVERFMTLTKPITVLNAWTHAHYRSTSAIIDAILPNGKAVPICNVPFYQMKYMAKSTLNPQVYLPAGTRIRSQIWYDNSDMNTANPDSTNPVSNGFQTDNEEMDYVRFIYVDGALTKNIKKEPLDE